jgi:hypothetical protein
VNNAKAPGAEEVRDLNSLPGAFAHHTPRPTTNPEMQSTLPGVLRELITPEGEHHMSVAVWVDVDENAPYEVRGSTLLVLLAMANNASESFRMAVLNEDYLCRKAHVTPEELNTCLEELEHRFGIIQTRADASEWAYGNNDLVRYIRPVREWGTVAK